MKLRAAEFARSCGGQQSKRGPGKRAAFGRFVQRDPSPLGAALAWRRKSILH